MPGRHVVVIGSGDDEDSAPLHCVVLDFTDDEQAIISDNVTPPISIENYQFRTAPVRIVWQVSTRRTFAEVLDERREHYARGLRG